MRPALKDAAQGRWKSILPALGLPMVLVSGKHGPCPICQDGKNRFRFDDKDGRGTWICSVCGAGDGIEFVKRLKGVDFKEAAALIEPLIGNAPVAAARAPVSDKDQRRWRNEAWLGAKPVQPDDPVGLFLQMRAGLTVFPPCLRCHQELEHRDEDGRKTRHPAMLAIVCGPDGKPANLHRTYLSRRGGKADVTEPRLMMPGLIPDGAAIRLAPEAEVLGIAEGIETALAASALFRVPCWSAVNASILAKWTPPAGTRRVIVFGDNDAGYAGQSAAFALARSISGRRLAEVEVRIPPIVGQDWNDVLDEKRAASHPALKEAAYAGGM